VSVGLSQPFPESREDGGDDDAAAGQKIGGAFETRQRRPIGPLADQDGSSWNTTQIVGSGHMDS
jgi:hypothetical protein